MKKRGNWRLVFLLTFLLFTIIASFTASFVSSLSATQSSGSIILNIGGTSSSLASGTNYFSCSSTYTYTSVTGVSMGQHDASTILVSVMDGELTLLEALNSVNKLCPNPAKPPYSKSAPNPGHYATEIILSGGKSLQQAINDGDYCITNQGWSAWSACSVPCGGGTQTRSCSNTALCGGANCIGSSSQSCNTQCCPVNGTWSAWSACSVPCGGGTKTRSCVGASCGGICPPDADDSLTSKTCNTQCCPINGGWSAWSCGSCDGSCGGFLGIQDCTRSCNSPPPSCGGLQCLKLDMTRGLTDYQMQTCITPCCAGVWSAWNCPECEVGQQQMTCTRTCTCPGGGCCTSCSGSSTTTMLCPQ